MTLQADVSGSAVAPGRHIVRATLPAQVAEQLVRLLLVGRELDRDVARLARHRGLDAALVLRVPHLDEAVAVEAQPRDAALLGEHMPEPQQARRDIDAVILGPWILECDGLRMYADTTADVENATRREPREFLRDQRREQATPRIARSRGVDRGSRENNRAWRSAGWDRPLRKHPGAEQSVSRGPQADHVAA